MSLNVYCLDHNHHTRGYSDGAIKGLGSISCAWDKFPGCHHLSQNLWFISQEPPEVRLLQSDIDIAIRQSELDVQQ